MRVADRWGYGRSTAFLQTLNVACNHAYDLHCFHHATMAIKERDEEPWTPEALDNTTEARRFRCDWVANHADIVAAVHVFRVELQVRYVMRDIIPCAPEEPFLFWFRVEWGVNGNPHAHGQSYVSGNPTFECVVHDEETRQAMLAH